MQCHGGVNQAISSHSATARVMKLPFIRLYAQHAELQSHTPTALLSFQYSTLKSWPPESKQAYHVLQY